MLEFEKIRFKNFLSYGNSWTEFEFEPGINRIAGANGSGKSALISALYFGLFGKPYTKINLPQLVNCINKEGLIVELYFTIRGDSYKIERGLKPNKFYIYKNDVLVPIDSNSRTYQQYLEQEILKFNDNLFNQTSLKSVTRDLSFLSLGKGDKRKIIENIFDMEFFSVTNQLAKSDSDHIDSKLAEIRKDIEYRTLLLEQETSNLQRLTSLRDQILAEQEKKIEENEREISSLTERLDDLEIKLRRISGVHEKRKNISAKIKEIKEKIKHLNERRISARAIVQAYDEKFNSFSSVCEGCEKVAILLDKGSRDRAQEENEKIESIISVAEEKLIEHEAHLKKANQVIANEPAIRSERENITTKIKQLKSNAYDEINEKINLDESGLNEHKNRIEELKTAFNELTNKKNYYGVLKVLLSDDGIKAYIIKRYLPYINKILNSYLQKFNCDILFYFDSEFNEVVGSKYKEAFSYASFSEGQKRRIDLAILFTFMDFAKYRNQMACTNLLILDEISSTLDAEGENSLYSILIKLAEKENKCILTVSHSGNLDPEKIKRLYEVTSEKGFSCMRRIQN